MAELRTFRDIALICVSYQYQRFFEEISQEIDEVFGPLESEFPELEVYLTGSMALLMRMADEVANSQFSSFTFAIAVISVIMIIMTQ